MVEKMKQMSATTAVLYYENQFNTEILLVKTHFFGLKLVISNIKKMSVMWGEIKHATVGVYYKCKLCC